MGEQRKQQNPNKVLNTIRILNFIRANGPVEIATISDKTGIALPTLYRGIKTLVDLQIIVEDGKEASVVGRKAKLYTVNAYYTNILGIVLEKNYLKAFVSGLDGHIRRESVLNLKGTMALEEIVEAMDTAVEQVMEHTFSGQTGWDKVERIGILSSSAIDVSAGTITDFVGREVLNGFPIVNYVQEKHGKPAKLMKVSAAEALSYADAMDTRGIRQYVYVHIGQGIGACLVVDGKLYEGKHGAAGEVEYFLDTATADGRIPVTTWQLYDIVSEYVASNPQSVLGQLVVKNEGKYTSRQSVLRHSIDEALGMQDPQCIALVSGAFHKWASLLWILSLCFDPEVMIIGGDISDRVPYIFDEICKQVKKRSKAVFLPADEQMTREMALARSVLDDSFLNIQKQIAE